MTKTKSPTWDRLYSYETFIVDDRTTKFLFQTFGEL